MKIVSGAISRCNTALLKIELGWESIASRRMNHILTMMYRIVEGDAPVGLTNTFDNLTSSYSSYNLRNNNLKIPRCKTTRYRNSFFPFAIRNWNFLKIEIRNSKSLKQFKQNVKNIEKPKKNLLFYQGERLTSILHARIRIGCSSLNRHLC